MIRLKTNDVDALEISGSKSDTLPDHEVLNENIEYGIPERSKWTLDDWLDFYDQYGESTEGYTECYDDEENE